MTELHTGPEPKLGKIAASFWRPAESSPWSPHRRWRSFCLPPCTAGRSIWRHSQQRRHPHKLVSSSGPARTKAACLGDLTFLLLTPVFARLAPLTRTLHVRRQKARIWWRHGLVNPRLQISSLVEESSGDLGVGGSFSQSENCGRLTRKIFFAYHGRFLADYGKYTRERLKCSGSIVRNCT